MGSDVFEYQIFSRIVYALVGGRYDNTSQAGLWYWNVNNDSSLVNATVGARPLISGFGVFCTDFVFCVSALVGGAWNNAVNAGLWYWNVNWTGTDYNTNVGARQLIFIILLTHHFPCPLAKISRSGLA